MARAIGKNSKRKRQRPASRRAKRRTAEERRAVRNASSMLDAVVRRRLSELRGDGVYDKLPALDWWDLPELMLLLHLARDSFMLGRRSTPMPSKEALEKFFTGVTLPNGKKLSRNLASAAATFVRPLAAMTGGRPKKPSKPPAEPPPGAG